MKKRSKVILSILITVLVLVVAALGVWFGINQKQAKEALDEAQWYNLEDKEFTITTAEELYNVAELSQYYDFKGQTLFLGSDIIVNEGDAAQWGENAPDHVWVPIKGFAGTFDGKGHTISGIYAVGINKSVGLFIDTDAACEIKNFRLENSYIKGLNDKGTGSVVGAGTGNLSSIYSNAIVVCESDNAGGLVGYWKSKKTSGMENCWFDGSVQSTSELSHYTGGLIGRVLANASICKIEHCLNSAEVTSLGQEVGGLIGAVAGETTIWFTDSFNAGQVNAPEGSLTAGMAVGKLYGSASINSKTSWVVKQDAVKAIGTTEGAVKGILADIAREEVNGFDAYVNTTLDFDKYWAVVEQDTPVLAYFTQNAPSVAGLERKYDLSWFDEKQTQLHISTVAQLNGLALLSQAYGFSGQTIILDNDLALNEGKASDWAKSAPENEWKMPIGRWVSEDGVTSGVAFSGTFDGNGHTISGLYFNLESTKAYNWGLFAKTKGTIKNLRLENSYIGGVAGGNVGSIAGGLEGATIENVYSNAILDMDTWRIGGLTGIIEGRGKTSTIKNCWFDGSVKGRERVGGFVGNINQDVGLVVEHGLNTGTITGTSHYIGGLVGIINKCTASITDSLNTGTVERTEGNRTGYYGAISGGVNGDLNLECEATFKNVFFLDDSCAKGYQQDKNHLKYITIIGQGAIQLNKEELTGNNAYIWSSLNFKDYWTTVNNGTPVLRTFAKSAQQAYGTKMVDYSWYSASGSSHTIKNAKQLWAFSILSRTDDFKNKTVSLGADITINDTKQSNWYEANLRNWKPIGRNVTEEGKAIGKAFAGTFNGNGHSISGLYIKLNSTKAFNWGLFAKTSGKIQNLKLKNSYISGVAGGSVGSVAGSLAGATLENIYSNATVSITSQKANTGKNIAGLAGIIEGKTSSVISNCWFDGRVSGVERVGGFAGGIDAASTLTISHGLNTGTVASSSNYVGGFLGIMNKSNLVISDCLNIGSVSATTSKTPYFGAIVGCLNGADGKEGQAKITDVYFLNGSSTKAYQVNGNNKAYVEVLGNGAVLLNKEELTGNNAYVWSVLDFDKYWTTVKGDMPMLRTFAKKTEKTSGKRLVAFDWHTLNGASHKLSTAEDLWGLTLLARTDNFAGETITLEKDIKLDKTDWQPIGKHEVTAENKPGQVFAGVFDGAEHSISGLTMVLESENKICGLFGQVSGTVKNLTLKEVSISGTASGKVGSVAGVLSGGTVENVHATANIDVEANFVGGLVGSVEGSNKATVAKSTFTTTDQGKVEGNKHIGGLVGWINSSSVDITGSENNGAVSTKVKDSNVGGLIGFVQKGAATITDSNNNGSVSLNGFAGKLGTVIGRIDGDETKAASVTFSNVTNTKQQDTAGVQGYTVDAADLEKAYVTITGIVADTSNPDAPNVSWYDPQKGTAEEPYLISSKADLLGLVQLAQTVDFADKIIKLTADIDLTDSNWTPIGQHRNSSAMVGVVFAGTFDGDNHTIKGMSIALTGKEGYQGLFGTVSGTVKNLVMADATISGTAANNRIGSVAGTLKGGTLENVRVTASVDVSANFVGGLVGSVEGSNKATVKNCSFTGTVEGNKHIGGLVGFVTGSSLGVTDSENNGAVSTKVADSNVGGLIGFVQKSAAVITNSENNGAVSLSGFTGKLGTVIGRIDGDAAGKAAVTFENVTNTKAQDAAGVTGYTVDAADLTNGYVIITGEVSDTSYQDPEIPGTGWYDPQKGTEEEPYLISSKEDLFGLARLAQSIDFAGKVIKLTADIDLTGESWAPIGQYKDGSNATVGVVFAGTFDGDNHTITGMNITLTGKEGYQGLFGTVSGTVKNLVLADATISGTAANNRIGSVAGTLKGGTLENVRVTAGVDVSAHFVGGLVGSVEGSAKSTINNCIFTGAVEGNKHIGGLVGYVTASSLDITGSENNGTVSTKVKDSNVGGLIGFVQKSAAVITDSENNGAVLLNGFAGNAGTIIGRIDGDENAVAAVTFNNVANTKAQNPVGTAGYNADAADVENGYVTITGEITDTTIPTPEEPDPTDPTEPVDPNTPDTDWYDPAKGTVEEPYIISTKGELLGLVQLAQTTDFVGKTIKLTADIDLTGESWTPIGKHRNSTAAVGVAFAGTFDGDNHTITGLSMAFTGKEGYQGLFGIVTGTVKNLVLADVTISGTASNNRIGAVAGSLQGGTLEKINVTASVDASANFVGGLVGSVEGTAKSTIKNCTFTGTVKGNKHIGGLVGYINTSALDIAGSENNATIGTKVADSSVGGLIGYAQKSTVTVTNSKNNGSVSLGEFTGYLGTVIGRIEGTSTAKASVTFADVTNTKAQAAQTPGYNISGTAAYVTVTGEVTDISNQDPDTPDPNEPDTSWYDPEKGSAEEPYVISTKGDLLGFVQLAQTIDFADKTIELTADIDLTGENWTPIGKHRNSTATVGVAFAGTFDGDDHTVTGLNLAFTGKEGYQGLFGIVSGTIKDLVIADATISGTASNNRIGGVVGSLQGGTLENVSVTANIDVSANFVGGLVGCVEGTNKSTITNCAFAGSVKTTNKKHIGGLVGYINTSSLDITGSENNGAVSADATTTDGGVGGLVGYAQKSTVTITNSKNNGTVSLVKENTGYLGTIVGRIEGANGSAAFVTFTNVTNTVAHENVNAYTVTGTASYATITGEVTDTSN